MLIGNGGGYGYGVMGSTHHCLEDYGALLTLPNIRIFVPAFDGDVRAIVKLLFAATSPAYLRLGLSEEPKDCRCLHIRHGENCATARGPAVLVVGRLVGGILAVVQGLPEELGGRISRSSCASYPWATRRRQSSSKTFASRATSSSSRSM